MVQAPSHLSDDEAALCGQVQESFTLIEGGDAQDFRAVRVTTFVPASPIWRFLPEPIEG